MATSTNYTTRSSQVNPAANIFQAGLDNGNWVAVLVGPIVGTSKLEVLGDGRQKTKPTGFELVESPSATPPSMAFVGHRLLEGEVEPVADLQAGQSIWGRAINSNGGTLIVTPGG